MERAGACCYLGVMSDRSLRRWVICFVAVIILWAGEEGFESVIYAAGIAMLIEYAYRAVLWLALEVRANSDPKARRKLEDLEW